MEILRAKTTQLFPYADLTERQRQNVLQNTKEMQEGDVHLASLPQRLVFELTNACNLACIMCGRSAKAVQNTYFDLEWLKTFEPVFNRVSEVTLFGWGEPTLHPQFRHILEYLAGFSIKKYVLTNGVLLHRFADVIVNTVDILALSLDGATAATNDSIRRGARLEAIIQSLRSIVAQRNASDRKRPHINLVMTLMKQNLHELPLLIDLAASLGIEEVKAVYLTAFTQDMANHVLWDRQSETQAVFSETLRRAEKNDILVKLPYIQGEDPAGNAPHRLCYVGWRDFFLGSDGFVRPCQSTSQQVFHIRERTTFEDMWNDAAFQAFRMHVNGTENMPPQCRICFQSSHANWNHRSSFLQNEVSSEFQSKSKSQ